MYQVDVIQTRFVEAPVVIGELAVWYKHGVPVTAQRCLPPIKFRPGTATMTEVAPVLASALQMPLVRGSVKVHKQAGRFVEVAYRPLRERDPTMIVALMPGAARFHQAMLAFCHLIRRHVYHWVEDTSWYNDALRAGRQVLQPLAQLQPTMEEAELVMRFLLDRITYGEPR